MKWAQRNRQGCCPALLSQRGVWPQKALRVFICSDFGLSDGEILSHYTHRWKIEVMFKQQKMYMGLKSFMVRSAIAIDRLFVILPLAHLFFIVLFDASLSLSAAIRRFRTLLCSF